MTQRLFFALPDDLLPVFQLVESKHRITYTLTGLLASSQLTTVGSGSMLPSLFLPASHSSVQCDSYLITLADTEIQIRAVPQLAGGTKFAVDQLVNPDSITITHGGVYSPGILISGRVATVSDTPTAKALQSAFSRAIAKSFIRVKAFWVGPGALELLKEGNRLTQSASSPREYDLAQ